jgi:hypothetical protein
LKVEEDPMNSKLMRAGAWTGAALLGAGLASGITWAAASSNGSGTTHAGAAAVPAATSSADPRPGGRPNARMGRFGGLGPLAKAFLGGGRGHGGGPHAAAGRLEFGSMTVRGKNGDVTENFQQGKVMAVTANSVEVTSTDGHDATYAVTSATMVRAAGKRATIGAVDKGDNVWVLAQGTSAQRIFDPKGAAGTSP